MRALCSLLLLTSTASAQVPGTFDDPVLAASVLPEVADAPLAQELIVRGQPVEVLFEGFAIPTVFHHRLRSMITYDSKLSSGRDVEYGGATNFLNITAPDHLARSAQLTSIDIGVSTLRVAPVATDDTTRYFDVVGTIGPVSALITEKFARGVYAKAFRFGAWRLRIAGSPLIDSKLQLDTRTQIEYRGPSAGLRRLIARLGVDTSNTDVAAYTSASALLSKAIIARAGVRVDGDGIQPRGSLETELPGSIVTRLEAGAYRTGAARTTEVAAKLAHTHGAYGTQLTAYYQDRIDAPAFGTAAGVELIESIDTRRWLGFVSASLSKSVQHDFYRAVAHPTTFDQPVRVNVVGKYKAAKWSLAARMQLSSGLPYLPVVESSYDSDSDTYEPIFARRRERLPFHHELSVRFDMRFSPHVRAFADVRNVYAADTTLAYAYSYDFKTRVATTLPVLPFIGVRGDI